MNDFENLSLSEKEFYEDEIFALKEEIRALTTQLDGYRASERKSAQRLLKADKEADEINKVAQFKYLTELRTLKLLSDKFRNIFADEVSADKVEIIGLLTDFLKDLDGEKGLFEAKDKAEKLGEKLGLQTKKEENKVDDDEFFFDLDEAINPTTPLDLEALCKELGVFGGEDK